MVIVLNLAGLWIKSAAWKSCLLVSVESNRDPLTSVELRVLTVDWLVCVTGEGTRTSQEAG